MSLTVIQRCNVCFKMKKDDKSFKLFFSNCGHLICDECRTSESMCPICDKKETTYVKIDDNLPDNLAIFFKDPAPMMKLYGKIIEFQNLQAGINQKRLQNQNKKLQQKIGQMEKDNEDNLEQMKHYKAKCSDLEIELERKDNQLRALIQVNENISTKKKIGRNIDDRFESKFEYKPEETKSTFFDPSQINQLKQVDENKRSPLNTYQESVKSSGSNPTQNQMQNYIKNRLKNNNNKINKPITYGNLEYYLK